MASPLEDPTQADANGEECARRPVVIVRYRRAPGSRFTTPILVLIAALAVLSHRVKIDDWRGVWGALPDPEPIGARNGESRVAVALADPPLALRAAWVPSVAELPARAPRPLALLGKPSPATHSAIALPRSGEETANSWAEIRRVSELAKAEALDMENLKALAQAQSRRQAATHPLETAHSGVRQTEESRQEFLDSLRLALSRPDGRGVQEVESLCRQHGVSLSANRPLAGTEAAPELTPAARRQRVESLRSKGVTEAAILEELVRHEARKRPARSGPKTRDEVLVRATKQLLAIQASNRRDASE